MNALGDRCHSVLVLVSTAHAPDTPLIDVSSGYHVGCVLPSPSPSSSVSSSDDIVHHAVAFMTENHVPHTTECVTADSVQACVSSGVAAAQHLTAAVTIMDATGVTDAAVTATLLRWLYGTDTPHGNAAESSYTLVAILDVSRGSVCKHNSTRHDVHAWLRPTPSYYSEMVDAAAGTPSTSASGVPPIPCCVFPVQVFSRYPVVRDCGLREVGSCADGEATPSVAEWVNKSTLDALLRELAFKAGQLAKYGA